MKKIIFEREKCIGCGTCAVLCPKFFEMGKDGRAELKDGVKEKDGFVREVEEIDCVKEAEGGCPVSCIHIKS